MKAWRALRPLPRRRAAAAVAADDRRQRGAQPAPLGRPAAARWRCARRARRATTARPRRRCSRPSRARALLGALARLRDDDRLVLGCRYLLELSEAETAAALGVQAGHREVAHLARARAPARGGDAVTDLEQRAARARRRLAGDARPRRPRCMRADRRAPRAAARGERRARGRLRAATVRSRWCVALGGTLAVSPDARSTVLRWLGLKSVEIEREPPQPPPIGAGARTSATRDRGCRAPATRVPVPALGEPDAVYVTTLPDGTRRGSLVYADGADPRADRSRRARTPFIEKTVGIGARRRALTSTARRPTGSPARTASPTSPPSGVRLRAAAARRPHAAGRARRAAAARRGRDIERATRARRDRATQFSDGSGGIVASSA